MERTESRKEHRKELKEQITDFEILRLNIHRKRGEIKNRVMYSSCLHDQQDLRWQNTSRDTSKELQVKRISICSVSWRAVIYLLVFLVCSEI